MYNTSTTLINFRLKDGETIVLEGQIPYGLLPYIEHTLLQGTSRILEFTVNTDTFETSREFSLTHADVPTSNAAHMTRIAYSSLINSKELIRVANLNSAAFDQWNLQADEENSQRESQRLDEIASQAQLYYQETLANQQTLTEQRLQELRDEAYRLDMLRAQTVTQIAVDPTTSVDALMSEVGHNGDVQRQISACMRANKDITRLIIASTSTLWNSSYELMDVIASQAATDKELANLLIGRIPEESLLYQSLDRLGMFN